MNKFFVSLLLFCFIATPYQVFALDIESIQEPQASALSVVEVQEKEGLPYDYTSVKRIPIELTIIEEISTKNPPNEGDMIDFKVRQNVFCKKKLILRAGQIIPARVENIIPSGMNGFPAEIVVGNFQFPNIKQSQLMGEYTKKGQNRCYFVYPLKWALTIIPFVGSLTNFIMGGHAKIKTTDVITVYYYPNW